MLQIKNNPIDEIKKKYKYDFNSGKNITRIIMDLYGNILVTLQDYNFKNRIKKIGQIIQEKASKINEEKLKLFDDCQIELEKTINNLEKKIDESFNTTYHILSELKENYEINRDKVSVEKLYQDMYKDILDKESKNYINYEKQFIIINDNINNLYKNLIN